MELKELKCKNCGANLKVDKSATEITCDFCHTSYSIETAEDTGYQFEKGRIRAQNEEADRQFKMFKDFSNSTMSSFVGFTILKIIVVVIFLTIIGVIGFTIYKQFSIKDSQMDISRFNSYYEMYSGSVPASSVKIILEKVVTNNKTNGDHIITVKYADISTSNSEEITSLKTSLQDTNKFSLYDYEISLNYDTSGYVSEIIINDYIN